MSRLLGSPEERWSLAQAVDALAHAARRGGQPSWLWLVGLVYPGLAFSLDLLVVLARSLGEALGLPLFDDAPTVSFFSMFAPLERSPGIESPLGSAIAGPIFLVLLIPAFRVIVGMARLVDPGPWHGHVDEVAQPRIRLRDAWRAGAGQGFLACGMSLLLGAFVVAAFLLLLGPWLALHALLDLPESAAALFLGLLVPFLALVWAYAVVLQVVHQLALMSLAHNRRGVLAGLTHGWRLVRASPWAAMRALVVDLCLFLVQCLGVLIATGLMGSFGWIFAIVLTGILGVTRATYWAHVYRALGGASTVEALEPIAA